MMPTRGLKNAIALAWSTLLWKIQAKLGTSLSSVFFRQPLVLTFFPRLCTLRIVLCVCSSGGFYLPSKLWILDRYSQVVWLDYNYYWSLVAPPLSSNCMVLRGIIFQKFSVFVVNWFFFSCSVFLFQLSPSGWTVWSSNFNHANWDNLSMFVFWILFRFTQVVVWRNLSTYERYLFRFFFLLSSPDFWQIF
jgi:hypothetical protein